MGTVQQTESKKISIGAQAVEIVSDSFSPVIGVMAGAGMLKALLVILVMFECLVEDSSTYLTLLSAANSVFYFLPVMLGASTAKRMGATSYLGAAVGAALLEPNFTSMIGATDSTFMSIPFNAINYSSTVFPILIAIAALALLEKRIRQYCPDSMKLFLVPMLSLLIIVPLTVMFLGPIGIYLGNLIASGIDYMQATSSILTGAVIGGGIMFCVIVGLHWGIFPVIIANAAAGGDTIFAMWAPSTFAQIGVAFAIYIRAHNKETRTLAGPATLTGMLAGVTEPIIYGLILRYRRTVPYVVIAGMIGGAFNGYFHVQMNAFAFQSLLTIPVYTPVLTYLIGIGLGFVIAVGLTMVFGYETKTSASLSNKPVTA